MEIEDNEDKIKGLIEFTEWVDAFCEMNHLPNINYQEEYKDALNLGAEDITMMSSDECLQTSIVLMNYASFIQKQKSLIQGKLLWCNSAIDYICSRQWTNYDKYMPADIKKKAIISENKYAEAIEKCRIRLMTANNTLEENYVDLKKRASIFESLGRKRSFE